MREQILPYVINDVLTGVHQHAGAHHRQRHAEKVDAHKCHTQPNEHPHILLRHGIIQRTARDLRAEQRHDARQRRQEQRRDHAHTVALHILHRPFEMSEVKRGFQLFVLIKTVRFHALSPPVVSQRSFCSA